MLPAFSTFLLFFLPLQYGGPGRGMNDMNGMDPNQPRVRDRIYELKSFIHKTDALIVLHQFENIHSWVDVSQIHET